MPVEHKKKKKYEPPIVKEIGGVFEQAMGVSSCITGGNFTSPGDCTGGFNATGGECGGGMLDQGCIGGPSNTDCGGGWGV